MWYNRSVDCWKSVREPLQPHFHVRTALSGVSHGQGRSQSPSPSNNYLPVWIFLKHWVDKQRTAFNLLTRRAVLCSNCSFRTTIVRNMMNGHTVQSGLALGELKSKFVTSQVARTGRTRRTWLDLSTEHLKCLSSKSSKVKYRMTQMKRTFFEFLVWTRFPTLIIKRECFNFLQECI